MICGTAVLLGAFGAHALENVLVDWYEAERAAQKLDSWKTGVIYQVLHGMALLILGVLSRFHDSRLLRLASVMFLAGVLLFSGSLYLWVLTDFKPFVMVVPVGGVSFLLGWLLTTISPLENPF